MSQDDTSVKEVLSYDAKVQPDRRLCLPKRARLKPGQKVHVQLTWGGKAALKAKSDHPLLGIVGLISAGPPDAAERHDHYLYGRSRKARKA